MVGEKTRGTRPGASSRRERGRSSVFVALVLAMTLPARASAEEGSSPASGKREVLVVAGTECPTREEFAEALRPLLPGTSVVVSEAPAEGSVGVHLVAWDETGISYDGELVKRGSVGECRRVAEDWAVAIALLVETPSEPALALRKETEKPKERAPSREAPVRRNRLVFGVVGGAVLPVAPDGEVRAFGVVDASYLFGMFGLRVAFGTTTRGAVSLEPSANTGTNGARASAEETWGALGLAFEGELGCLRGFASLGSLFALDRVEGSGLGAGVVSSALAFGIDANFGVRVPLGRTWSVGMPLGLAFFPVESALLARNATSGAEVRLGTLPRLLPRVGLGVYAQF